MTVSMSPDGRIRGRYSSTTGSTGTYPLLGWADPRGAAPDRGQSLALSISWRSMGPEAPDPSWHWVSALGGQRVGEADSERLILLHDMVATVESPGQARIGRHLDKLVFSRRADDSRKNIPEFPAAQPASMPADSTSILDGEWGDDFDPAKRLSFRLLDRGYGTLSAMFVIDGLGCEMMGFADVVAEIEGLPLLALSLSGLNVDAEAISLSGSLDLSTMVMTLASFCSSGTAPSLSYTQTRFDQYRLRRMR